MQTELLIQALRDYGFNARPSDNESIAITWDPSQLGEPVTKRTLIRLASAYGASASFIGHGQFYRVVFKPKR